jgi:hypothetical protein
MKIAIEETVQSVQNDSLIFLQVFVRTGVSFGQYNRKSQTND